MPPKGWRKDAQGNYPTTSYIKEQESITIHDLLFPKSVVMQLARNVNGDDDRKLLINKDVSLALQRSATVFVNHLLIFAREYAKNQDRKSCNLNDIYDALDQIGFGGFKSIINNKMIEYQNVMELKKKHKQQQSAEVANDEQERADPGDEDTENEEEGADDEGAALTKKQKTAALDNEA